MDKKIKALSILIICIIIYGLLPISTSIFSNSLSSSTFKVERQECGCPCPNARIIDGAFVIPEEWTNQYPQLKSPTHEINLSFKAKHKSIENFWLINSEVLIVSGNMIGVDTILCNPEFCELTPLVNVNQVKTITYTPQFWTFKSNFLFYYFSFSFFGLVFLLVNLVKQLV